MGRWDQFFIYRGPDGGINWELTLAEAKKMADRMEMVKDIAVGMDDVTEALKRELVALRQKRKALEDNKELWAIEMLGFLDVLIEDHEWVAKDAHDDIQILTDGHIPAGYKFNRRGRTNHAA